VTISPGLGGPNTISSDSGNGNINKIVTVCTTAGVTTLNAIVKDGSQQYINLHTSVNPGGAIRDQLAGTRRIPLVQQ
jgi:hypothetical protein